jgi:hypothetical protein
MGFKQDYIPFKFSYRGEYEDAPSIYKAFFGDQYLVWKCKSIKASPIHISRDIAARLNNSTRNLGQFTKAIDAILRGQIDHFEVELVEQHQEAINLLKAEYRILQQCKQDPNCLNVEFLPLTPQWIPAVDIAEYTLWLSTL